MPRTPAVNPKGTPMADADLFDTTTSDVLLDPAVACGYRRSAALQSTFDAAVRRLQAADRVENPLGPGRPGLVADLALEGGGVKGIGLVGAVLVLSEAGYTFPRVAGTSAGAIAATLIAALSKQSKPMTQLKALLDTLDFQAFMPEGRVHRFLDHRGRAGRLVADALALSHKPGVYPGDYLEEWLDPILQNLGVQTFEDLKIGAAEDPAMSLPEGREYRLVVHTSDVTRRQLARLPWDYPIYGHRAEGERVVEAVRASMSIPFFFEPVTFDAHAADVPIRTPDGRTVPQHYDAGTVTWVDGGMLRNFPISAFDRIDGKPARWPTIGIKLSSLPTSFPPTRACGSAVAVGVHCLRTVLNEWDTYNVDETTAARTIFVDSAGLSATAFDLTTDQQNQLFLNGVRAGTEFVIEMAAAGGVPRGADDAALVARSRRELATTAP
jgi:NTE family protein